jgi:sec-independent protein translocase protein TatB
MLSIPHMIVVFVVVLVVFGPQKLPELAKGLGKLMAEFRKASTDFKSAFENEMRDLERQAAEVERKKRELLASVAATTPQPATLATPSNAETQPPAGQLAESNSGVSEGERLTEAAAGTPMTPIISPVAEAVARSSAEPEVTEVAAADATHAGADGGAGDGAADGSASNGAVSHSTAASPISSADADAIAEKPQRTTSPAALDAPHDYKQPA